MKLLLFIVFNCFNTFSQSTGNWPIKKHSALSLTGVSTEGHDVSFTTIIFKKNHQFIEMEGGLGTFLPNDQLKETASTGVHYNTGGQHHFFSVGIQFIYATDQTPTFADYFDQTKIAPSTLVGYYYSNSAIQFKLQLKPNLPLYQPAVKPLMSTVKGFGSVASLTIQLNKT